MAMAKPAGREQPMLFRRFIALKITGEHPGH
jgi:hypothetical protein